MNKLWTIIIIVIVVVAAGWVWKYKWTPSQSASQNPTEISDINQDLQGVNIDNVDPQFQSIDKDLQGL